MLLHRSISMAASKKISKKKTAKQIIDSVKRKTVVLKSKKPSTAVIAKPIQLTATIKKIQLVYSWCTVKI